MKIGGQLSKRERQIMDLVYERGTITASELEQALPGGLSNSAVRTYLRSLETKGFLTHEGEGVKYVYRPTRDREDVARLETNRLLKTFFGGSISDVLATLLSDRETNITDAELEEMRRMIEEAKRK